MIRHKKPTLLRDREKIEKAGPGSIVAAVGLRDAATGDTLCDPKHPILTFAINGTGSAPDIDWQPTYLGFGPVAQGTTKTLTATITNSGDAVLKLTSRLLRSRAAVVAATSGHGATPLQLQAWIQDDALLTERLQAARDLLFAAADTPHAGRETAATGKSLSSALYTTTQLIVQFYDGTFPGAAGNSLTISGSYEAA